MISGSFLWINDLNERCNSVPHAVVQDLIRSNSAVPNAVTSLVASLSIQKCDVD
jgi:hypothetical protein